VGAAALDRESGECEGECEAGMRVELLQRSPGKRGCCCRRLPDPMRRRQVGKVTL